MARIDARAHWGSSGMTLLSVVASAVACGGAIAPDDPGHAALGGAAQWTGVGGSSTELLPATVPVSTTGVGGVSATQFTVMNTGGATSLDSSVVAAGGPATLGGIACAFRPSGGAAREGVRCPDGWCFYVSGSACGNGVIGPDEMCDDGNIFSGDGCDSRCRQELAWICSSAGRPCTRCGNCQLDSGEGCDDGNRSDGDGCSANCRVEADYVCGAPSEICVWVGHCGDGEVSPISELCDDGNTAGGDGCSSDCQAVESGYVCPRAGEACESLDRDYPHCGDGVVQPEFGEQCDVGLSGSSSSDCAANCRVPYCGDGMLQRDLGETCDDGILSGAYLHCGYGCNYSRPACGACELLGPWCGDGAIQDDREECDNGDANGKDGLCSVECTKARSGFCGDGVVDKPYEECDDGNLVSCDDCSARCQSEWRILI